MHRNNEDCPEQITYKRIRVRVALDRFDDARRGFAFTRPRRSPTLTRDEAEQAIAERDRDVEDLEIGPSDALLDRLDTSPALARWQARNRAVFGDALDVADPVERLVAMSERLAEHPVEAWLDGVRITHGGVAYEVVPIKRDGHPAELIAYAEIARRGALPDEPRLDRQYLATLAHAYLHDPRPDGRPPSARFDSTTPLAALRRRRPDDARLLKIVRDALDDGSHPRRVLSDLYGVSIRTADDWVEHARALPGANLPPARRGRPRKRPNPIESENER